MVHLHSAWKLCVIVLVLLVASGASTPLGDSAFKRIPPEVAQFLEDEFNAVPAPSVAARAPGWKCRKDMADGPGFSGVGRALVKGAYYCQVDFGCGHTEGVPVWFDADGVLWFGPDGAGQLVARFCADAISDPARRKTFSDQIDQGG